jgi:predicted lactoylglutathione lyase
MVVSGGDCEHIKNVLFMFLRSAESIREWRRAMNGYVTLDTRDLGRAAKFYDRLARELGARRSMEDADCVAWGIPGGPASISLVANGDAPGAAAAVALEAADPEQVQRLYALAIEQGGASEAEPCELGGFYAASFRDLDGNRLSAFCITRH